MALKLHKAFIILFATSLLSACGNLREIGNAMDIVDTTDLEDIADNGDNNLSVKKDLEIFYNSGMSYKVYPFPEADEDTKSISVKFEDGRQYTVSFKEAGNSSIEAEAYSENDDYVLETLFERFINAYVIIENEKTYLAVCMECANDYNVTEIIDFTDEPEGFCGNLLITSVDEEGENVILTGRTKLDIIGSYYAEGRYHIDGTEKALVPVNEMFDISSMNAELVLKTELDAFSEDGSKIQLKQGDSIRPTKTDAKGKFYFQTEDGMNGYLEYTEEMEPVGEGFDWDYPVRRINSKKEEDVFENIPYFG